MPFAMRIIERPSTYWRNAALRSKASWRNSPTFQTLVPGSVKIACVTHEWSPTTLLTIKFPGKPEVIGPDSQLLAQADNSAH